MSDQMTPSELGVQDIPIERPKTRYHAEYHILKFLIEGNSANMNGLADLARQMGADVNEEGEPLDKTAHKRFKNGFKEVHKQLERLLRQRKVRIQGKEVMEDGKVAKQG